MDDHLPVGTGFDRPAAQDPDAVARYAPDGVVTRSEPAAASSRAAREFAALGAGHDDLMTIGLGNGAAFYAAVLGAWKLGAVPQPVSAKLPPAELAALVEIADPPLVVGLEAADRPWLPRPAAAHQRLAANLTAGPPDASLSPEPLPPALPPSWKAPTSGGSTGRPKIIVAGSAGWPDGVTQRAERLRIGGPGDVLAVTAPLYHNAPFMFSLIALLRGCPLLVLDRFDGAHVLESSTNRSPHTRGRPPLPRSRAGSNGAITDHTSSVRLDGQHLAASSSPGLHTARPWRG